MNQQAPTGATSGRRRSRRAEAAVAASFLASIAGALGLCATYVAGGQPQLEGTFLALSLGGIGFGMAVWAKRFMPNDEREEERGEVGSTEEEVAAFTAAFEEGERVLGRRRLLSRLAVTALGALGLAALFPLRSLGPRPRGLDSTAFSDRRRTRLVDEDGQPLRPDDLARGGVYTTFPEGEVQSADAPTLLIRIDQGELRALPGREGWTVGDDVIAYSKLCTHLGCPVGLFQSKENVLLCPCHQSTFDVLDHGRPVFGPATRPLPQLPLDVDDDGFIVATGDFSEPTGGGYWDRGRT